MVARLKHSHWQPLRYAAAVLLVTAVAMVHGCVADLLAGFAATNRADPMPPRMQAVYVRNMELVAPTRLAPAAPEALLPARPAPAALQPARPVPRPKVPEPVVRAASTPDSAQQEQVAAAEPVGTLEPTPVTEAASAVSPASAAGSAGTAAIAEPAASAPLVTTAASAPPDTPVFEWPAATRVTFNLTGHYRGDIFGTAQVEWLREGDRYQVHLDVSVPPLMSRRMSSQGLITIDGLAPQRYEQETWVAFNGTHRSTVMVEPNGVRLANGAYRERWPGLQDTASQFVQLAWMLSTRPELLRPGGTVEMPLAMPRTLERMVYDVLEPETQHTLFGEIAVVHLKPRRVARAGADMTLEMWLAPQFRYLPVRVIIRQDAYSFIDLAITRPPQLAAP